MSRLSIASRGRPIGWRLALAIAAVASAAAAGAGEPWPGDLPKGVYRLEPQHSQLIASLRFLGVSRYPVSFSGMTGRMETPQQAADVPRVTIRVDPRSISNPRSAVARSILTMLEPDRFPQIRFVSRGLTKSDGQLWLAGDLTMHGVTRPVRLTLTVQKGADGPAGFTACGRGRIRRSEFGMPQMRTLVGDQVDLTFQAQFARTPAQAPVQGYAPEGSHELE